MDGILITYNDDANVDKMLLEFNKIYTTLHFTIEEENNNKINFLDITIFM